MNTNENDFKGVFIHPTAEVSKEASILRGTSIWNQAQIRENAKIGLGCNIGKDVYVDFDVKIGNYVKIQNGISIYHGVEIEDDVFLGPHMTFTNDKFPRAWNGDFKLYPTLIKRGASIGAHATLICGITIGEYAMIGAGSVVTKDVPPHALVLGNPAKFIGLVCKCGQIIKKVEKFGNPVLMNCSHCGETNKIDVNVYKSLSV
jgi:UDP-2-acetamido-3-amino-2,3-dideoxy-glucuronate N-acetyltransferase